MVCLPPEYHPAREAYDPDEIGRIANGQYLPPSLPEAKALARDAFRHYAGARHLPRPKAFVYFVLRADDNIELVSIGARGGHKVVWRFGPLADFRAGK